LRGVQAAAGRAQLGERQQAGQDQGDAEGGPGAAGHVRASAGWGQAFQHATVRLGRVAVRGEAVVRRVVPEGLLRVLLGQPAAADQPAAGRDFGRIGRGEHDRVAALPAEARITMELSGWAR
jgi:hypothetical protein